VNRPTLYEHAVRLGQELAKEAERLNETLRDVEDLMHERGAASTEIVLPGSGKVLSWDGEFLYVGVRDGKCPLLKASRGLRCEAAHAIPVLFAASVPSTP
jgi:hypothetical protein